MTNRQLTMTLSATELAICRQLGTDPVAYARAKLRPNQSAKPLSAEAEIHAKMGIQPVDAGRLEHALAYVAPFAARQMSDWRQPTHHAAEAAETLKSWKPGDSVDRLAAAAGHLIAALAKSGVQSDMDDEDGEAEDDK